jgi:hypothetical protein
LDFSGDDQYEQKMIYSGSTTLPGNHLFADLSGNDSYDGVSHVFGSGYFGIGILLDQSGNDQYQALSHSQGAASFGIGILIDQQGNDQYKAGATSQGFGGVQGIGMLIDITGNDMYIVMGVKDFICQPCTFSQGAGFGLREWAYGGLGILYEGHGNDQYYGLNYNQGAGYYGGLGILKDREGNDSYKGNMFVQGVGVHTAIGILEDDAGNDQYKAVDIKAQGMGWDAGIGYLLEAKGDDTYEAGNMAQGFSAQNSYAALVDLNGKDVYQCKDLFGCQGEGGGTTYYIEQNAENIGILYDCNSKGDLFSHKKVQKKYLENSDQKCFLTFN